MAELILSIHGIKNTAVDREEWVFKPLRRRFESSSRLHTEKNIRRMTWTGYVFMGDFLKK